ncbi:pentatricopeptide repeat-containing protein At2g20540-like [Dendrobium catenatum]|uniref:Pentatricopeptide repeat-containing protein n=1 Tax=Dendrobium catenatum TaxID=906689 RepID=A0A2I0VR41_9ASPA|nr:pentatricopeptide repeat-containing protein At2g20540-like [Dendrobium catenatum]PKU65880.1 Pentatricopeptide repeat-containing protein [Dendrobium catenatum]
MRGNSTWLVREIEDQIFLQLRKCTSLQELKKIHAQILVSFLSQSSFLSTQIINICNVNGRIDCARQVFNQVLDPNIFLYNAMIKACTQSLRFIEAIDLYKRILSRSKSGDRFTYPFVLKACAGLVHHQLGKQIHLRTITSGLSSNPFVNNSLIEMYAKVDDLINAQKVFDELSLKDPVAWNILISSHARLGQMKKAIDIFNSMPNRTLVSWTIIISSHSMAGRYSEAIAIFRCMQMEGFEPDEVSIVSVLAACDIELGKWIQLYSEKHGFLQKTFVCNALIEMHCRCGSIEQALQIFKKTPEKDVISWSTMILGLSMNGRGEEAVKLFVQMEDERRVRPNGVTFLGLLTGCAHTGLVQQGLQYFSSMKEIYGIEPGVEHYGCIVDLLSRSGFISSAVEFVDNMPISPDAPIWGSLLSACASHGNVEVAAMAMEELAKLEPDDLGNYVLLSNMYAGEKMWEDVGNMRRLMRNRFLKKKPGCSSIQVGDGVQVFMSGDGRHLRNVDMADMLAMVARKIGDFSSIESEVEDNDYFEAFLFL